MSEISEWVPLTSQPDATLRLPKTEHVKSDELFEHMMKTLE